MGNPTFCPLVSTGCSLRISGCQHITPAYSDVFSWEIKVFFLCYLLLEMWLSGQGLIVILLSDSFRIKLRYYTSVALKAFARFCVGRASEVAFPLDLWPQSALTSLCSSLCALCLERRPWHSILQPSPQGAPGQACRKKIPGRFRIFPTELGWDVKIESGELG